MVNTNKTRGFTIVELMVVIFVIAILTAFLLSAVTRSTSAAKTLETKNSLREIHSWMQAWSGDNKERVLPSQFDWFDEKISGALIQVRDGDHLGSEQQYKGTWTDILWSMNSMHETYALHETVAPDHTYLRWKSDSPNADIYNTKPNFNNPFRSQLLNSRDFYAEIDAAPKPFGPGAQERDLDGFFAANNFFDARSDQDGHPDGGAISTSKVDRYYTYGMLNAPSKSLYLVDSVAGEIISHKTTGGEEDESAWLFDFGRGSLSLNGAIDKDKNPTGEIDYRYGAENGSCLILLLDGHIVQETPWNRLGLDNEPVNGVPDTTTLQGRGHRVGNLTQRVRTP